jgi:hypothetical protein
VNQTIIEQSASDPDAPAPVRKPWAAPCVIVSQENRSASKSGAHGAEAHIGASTSYSS